MFCFQKIVEGSLKETIVTQVLCCQRLKVFQGAIVNDKEKKGELMELKNSTIGFAITGSFCTFEKIKRQLEILTEAGANVIPIFSNHTQTCDNRFGGAKEFVETVQKITGNEGISTIQEAEPIGPKAYLDILIIAPCTGNTMAKFCNGITDSPVLMAAKAHIRNNKPLVIGISTNDALGMNFKNIGMLLNMKNIYFVPFGQDNYEKKPNSMVAHMELIPATLQEALEGRQIQPIIQSPY